MQSYSAQVTLYDYMTVFRVRSEFRGLKNETNPENQDLYGEILEISISGFV